MPAPPEAAAELRANLVELGRAQRGGDEREDGDAGADQDEQDQEPAEPVVEQPGEPGTGDASGRRA